MYPSFSLGRKRRKRRKKNLMIVKFENFGVCWGAKVCIEGNGFVVRLDRRGVVKVFCEESSVWKKCKPKKYVEKGDLLLDLNRVWLERDM